MNPSTAAAIEATLAAKRAQLKLGPRLKP